MGYLYELHESGRYRIDRIMKIGIIHFSGTHLREAHKNHTIERKRQKIFLSLKSRLVEFEQIFIVISQLREFPREGKEDEQVKSFYRKIKTDLEIFSNKEVSIVGAPEDRDCRFENVECAWKYIIEAWEKEQFREKNQYLLVECGLQQMEYSNSQEEMLYKNENPKFNRIMHSSNWQHKASYGELEKFLTIYGESGTLPDRDDPNKSHFNLLSFDSEGANICVSNFNYKNGKYHENAILSDMDSLNDKSKETRRYSLSGTFSDHLDSLDAHFLEEGHEKWKSDNLCVDPFLKFVDPKTNKLSIGRFNKLLEGGKLDKAILIGDGGAGKTFLSNKLFKYFHSKALIPLLIKGSDILKPDIEFVFKTLLREAFEKHYSKKEHEYFGEIDQNRIVLIIDDFNACPLKDKFRNLFVKNVNAHLEKTIFNSNSIMFFNSISHGELANYQTYNLVEYSFKMGSDSIGK